MNPESYAKSVYFCVMKHFLLSFFCFALATAGKAQDVEFQWASYVIYAESEYEYLQYSAKQALGKPNSVIGKDNFCAWTPKKSAGEKQQTLIVGFDKMIKLEQLVINENLCAGLITSVKVGCMPKPAQPFKKYPQNVASRKEVYKQDNPKRTTAKDFLYINPASPVDSVNFVEIEVWCDGWVQIDAVGIATSQNTKPITVRAFNFKNVVIENIKSINSKNQEISPVISQDGNTLYFTRAKHPNNRSEKQDVWAIDLNKENAQPYNVGEPINTVHHNSAFCSFGNDQKLLLNNIYNADSSMEKGLSYSIKQGEKWSRPKEVKIKDFYNKNNYSEYFLTQDEKVLLMTVERGDTYGGKDICVSFKENKDKTTYSKPINLGKTINTAANETSPFLSANGKVLFFSTVGHLGFGSHDIFLAYRLDDTWTNWSEPINLGTWINTAEWDAYFTMTAKGDYIYFASYKNAIGDCDIFRVKLTEEMRKALLGN